MFEFRGKNSNLAWTAYQHASSAYHEKRYADAHTYFRDSVNHALAGIAELFELDGFEGDSDSDVLTMSVRMLNSFAELVNAMIARHLDNEILSERLATALEGLQALPTGEYHQKRKHIAFFENCVSEWGEQISAHLQDLRPAIECKPHGFEVYVKNHFGSLDNDFRDDVEVASDLSPVDTELVANRILNRVDDLAFVLSSLASCAWLAHFDIDELNKRGNFICSMYDFKCFSSLRPKLGEYLMVLSDAIRMTRLFY